MISQNKILNTTNHYRAITNKTPLKDFWPPDFPRGFYYSSKIQPKILLGFYYSQKKIACGALLLFYFSKNTKFGLSGGRFFNEIVVFALKNVQKVFACGGLPDLGFYYSPKNFACGVLLLFFIFQNLLAFIIFSKS